jgi:glycosyltransferase involved in cell wall biosynthesis
VRASAAPVEANDPSGSAVGRVRELSFFFPAHNEEANLEALVQESLEALPKLADRFEIIAVDDGSRDRTPQIADDLAARYPDSFRVVHHPTNLGYGAALRSGFRAARFELVAFIDGDRQFKVADVGLLTARIAAPDAPDVVLGYRLKRADPPIRRWYARIYRLSNRLFFGVRARDIDCACKLFKRESLTAIRVFSGGAFFTAELLIKLRYEGKKMAEVGVPHYARIAGSPTGAKPSVVFRAVRDFWSLRLRLWFQRGGAMQRGEAILGPNENSQSAAPAVAG